MSANCFVLLEVVRFLFKNSRSFCINFFDSGFLGKLVFENFWTIGGNRLVLDPVGMFPLFLFSPEGTMRVKSEVCQSLYKMN